jgi:hypothetical protein
MLSQQIYNDSGVKSYVKTQLKLIKKNKLTVNSNEIFSDIIEELEKVYNILYASNIECIIKLDKKNKENAPANIGSVIKKHYEGLDVSLLFKIFILDNEIIIRRKRKA